MRFFARFEIQLVFIMSFLSCATIESSDEFADELLIALFESDKLVSLNLLFEECWNEIPLEQRNFLLRKRSLSILNKEDFEYEITKKNLVSSPYKKYCIEPTHEFKLYNLKWDPTVSVLTLDLIKIDKKWKITTPIISDAIFREIEESYQNVLNEHENVKAILPEELALHWSTMVNSGGTMVYDAIDEVIKIYEVSWDAAVLVLIEIKEMSQE